jgi:hypothetical protein
VKFTEPLPEATTVPLNPRGPRLGVTVEPFVTPLTSEASRWSVRTGWGTTSEIVAVLEAPLREAVMVAVCAEESVVVLTVNVTVVEFPATITEAGSANGAALSERETVVPPAGAGLEIVTVQVVFELAASFAAAHCSEETVVGTTRDKGRDWVEPLREAVMTTPRSAENDLAVALKVALLAPAGMVRDAGTVTLAELELKPTVTGWVAAPLNPIVQRIVPPGFNIPRLQVSELSVTMAGGTTRDKGRDWVEPLREAVRMTPRFAKNDLAVALKVTLLAPAGMETDAGTVTLAELELKPIVTGWVATPLNRAVQRIVPPGFNIPRLQVSELSVTMAGAGTVTVAPADEMEIAAPAKEASTALLRPIADVLPPAATVIETVAAVPFAMVFEFSPVARHVYAFALPAQVIDLLADSSADPGATVKVVRFAAG